METKYKIGDEVKDKLTGRTGIITGIHTEYIRAKINKKKKFHLVIRYILNGDSFTMIPEGMLDPINTKRIYSTKSSKPVEWRYKAGRIYLSNCDNRKHS
jgi:hypothetical protein